MVNRLLGAWVIGVVSRGTCCWNICNCIGWHIVSHPKGGKNGNGSWMPDIPFIPNVMLSMPVGLLPLLPLLPCESPPLLLPCPSSAFFSLFSFLSCLSSLSSHFWNDYTWISAGVTCIIVASHLGNINFVGILMRRVSQRALILYQLI